jgi:hypothetical protein
MSLFALPSVLTTHSDRGDSEFTRENGKLHPMRGIFCKVSLKLIFAILVAEISATLSDLSITVSDLLDKVADLSATHSGDESHPFTADSRLPNRFAWLTHIDVM